MAANNVHIPDDLLSQAQRLAQAQGRSADDLAADALKRYLAHEWLNAIEREGAERRQQDGLITDEDVERRVGQIISEHRRGTHGR